MKSDYVINNTGLHHLYLLTGIYMIQALLESETSDVFDWLEQTNNHPDMIREWTFAIENEDNTSIPCSAVQMGQLYQLIDFVAKAFVNGKYEYVLYKFTGSESSDDFKVIRDKFLQFAIVALKKFSSDLNKYPEFAKAVMKTNALSMAN